MANLPSFLQPLHDSQADLPYRNAVFPHKHPLAPTHAMWWPAQNEPDTVLLFIPGNPGLLGFYTPFLSAIHNKDTAGGLAILAHAHIGHTPGISGDSSRCDLTLQVESAIETFDAIKSAFGLDVKVVIVGHSVGAWVALQVLKARQEKVAAVFLLFPTVCHIAKTPNGRHLSWLFRSPMPTLVSSISRLTRLLPTRLLSVLFRSWPLPQVLVLRSLLHSPSSVYASLTMANDEMNIIQDLDVALLDAHKHRLSIYLAEEDDWVGEQREVLLRAFEADPGSVRVVHGHLDIPHAFCINHGEQVAEQCHKWLQHMS